MFLRSAVFRHFRPCKACQEQGGGLHDARATTIVARAGHLESSVKFLRCQPRKCAHVSFAVRFEELLENLVGHWRELGGMELRHVLLSGVRGRGVCSIVRFMAGGRTDGQAGWRFDEYPVVATAPAAVEDNLTGRLCGGVLLVRVLHRQVRCPGVCRGSKGIALLVRCPGQRNRNSLVQEPA